MRRSERSYPQDADWYDRRLYDSWPTKVADTRDGILASADLFDQIGDHKKAEQVRKGAKAFEGRPAWLSR